MIVQLNISQYKIGVDWQNSDVICNGNEISIDQCMLDSSPTCNHGQDVGLIWGHSALLPAVNY